MRKIIQCHRCTKNLSTFYNTKTDKLFCATCQIKWKIKNCIKPKFLNHIVKRLEQCQNIPICSLEEAILLFTSQTVPESEVKKSAIAAEQTPKKEKKKYKVQTKEKNKIARKSTKKIASFKFETEKDIQKTIQIEKENTKKIKRLNSYQSSEQDGIKKENTKKIKRLHSYQSLEPDEMKKINNEESFIDTFPDMSSPKYTQENTATHLIKKESKYQQIHDPILHSISQEDIFLNEFISPEKENVKSETNKDHQLDESQYPGKLSIDINISSQTRPQYTETPEFSPNCLKKIENPPTKPKPTPRQKNFFFIPVRTKKRRNSLSMEIKFCFSDLEDAQWIYVEKTLNSIFSKFRKFKMVKCVSQATHLIVNTKNGICTRTYKYLYAGLKGIPILEFNFYYQFVKTSDLSIFSKYLVIGDTGRGLSTLSSNVFRSDKRLFKNVTFYFKDLSISSDCKRLIELAGGQIRKGNKEDDDIEIDHVVEIYDFISANNIL